MVNNRRTLSRSPILCDWNFGMMEYWNHGYWGSDVLGEWPAIIGRFKF
ncbi:hypothetical protein D1AOALGA4SA_2917 [Olavius algarvensis Delta 1 endosymbiont]|nr:hypothetical protein D1AOALGA4SA_2917 [Olavius algarvensis Delta 1 endosymbiont]